jgi:hypothetical protein
VWVFVVGRRGDIVYTIISNTGAAAVVGGRAHVRGVCGGVGGVGGVGGGICNPCAGYITCGAALCGGA